MKLGTQVELMKEPIEEWIAFVGMLEGRPYEIFTGKVEEDVLLVPPSIKKGLIYKVKNADGTSRYDFQYTDKYGNPCTIGGLSYMFDKKNGYFITYSYENQSEGHDYGVIISKVLYVNDKREGISNAKQT